MSLYFIRQTSAQGHTKWFTISNKSVLGGLLDDILWDSLSGWRFYRRQSNYLWAPSYISEAKGADKQFRVCDPVTDPVYQESITEIFPKPVLSRDYSEPLFDYIGRHVVEMFVVDRDISLAEFLQVGLLAEPAIDLSVDADSELYIETSEGSESVAERVARVEAEFDWGDKVSLWDTIKRCGISSAVYDGSVKKIELSADRN